MREYYDDWNDFDDAAGRNPVEWIERNVSFFADEALDCLMFGDE